MENSNFNFNYTQEQIRALAENYKNIMEQFQPLEHDIRALKSALVDYAKAVYQNPETRPLFDGKSLLLADGVTVRYSETQRDKFEMPTGDALLEWAVPFLTTNVAGAITIDPKLIVNPDEKAQALLKQINLRKEASLSWSVSITTKSRKA